MVKQFMVSPPFNGDFTNKLYLLIFRGIHSYFALADLFGRYFAFLGHCGYFLVAAHPF